jgi:hypothetical protein
LYSEDFSNASWAQSYLTENITTNSATAPNGTVTADTISDSSGNFEFAVGQQISVTPNVPYTFSVFAKANGSSFLYLRYYGNTELFYYTSIFDLSNGTVTKSQIGSSASGGSTTITAMGNGWYRLTVTATVNSGTLVPMIGIAASGTDTIGSFGQINVNGTGSRSCYIWGAQLEAGSFATSYIPTVAASVTRSADVASVNTLSPWYNQTEMSIYTEFELKGLGASGGGGVVINDGTASFADMIVLGEFNASNSYGARVFVSSSAQFDTFISDPPINSVQKFSAGYKANDFAFTRNNTSPTVDTSGTMPTGATTMRIGRSWNNNYISGWIRRIAYYSVRLTNAQLQALTL